MTRPRKEAWSRAERLRLWDLRQQNPQIKWSQFRNRFFPHRTTGALMTHYSSMKTNKVQVGQTVNTDQEALQHDRPRPSNENEGVERPPSKRRKPTPRGADDGNGNGNGNGNDNDISSSAEGSELGSESDSETETETESESDSEAGDIPYENGPTKGPSQPTRQAGNENMISALAKKKIQRTAPPADNNGSTQGSTQTTIRSIKLQSPSDPGARAGCSGTMPQSSQNSQVYLSPVDSPEVTAATVRQTIPTQPAANTMPMPSGEQYTSLLQTFQQATAVFADYPQVIAQAENAKRECAEKQRTIEQMEASHRTEISELRARLATQNTSMQEQKATIDGLQAQMQTAEEQYRNKITEQANRLTAMETALAEKAHVETPGDGNRKDDERADCMECSKLHQENNRLTEDMANIRDLLNRVIVPRVAQRSPTRTGTTAEVGEPVSAS